MVIMMVINAMIMTSTVTFIIETMPSLEDVDENIWCATHHERAAWPADEQLPWPLTR